MQPEWPQAWSKPSGSWDERLRSGDGNMTPWPKRQQPPVPEGRLAWEGDDRGAAGHADDTKRKNGQRRGGWGQYTRLGRDRGRARARRAHHVTFPRAARIGPRTQSCAGRSCGAIIRASAQVPKGGRDRGRARARRAHRKNSSRSPPLARRGASRALRRAVGAARRDARRRALGRGQSGIGCRHARAQQRGAAQARPCSAAPPRCAPRPSSGCDNARRTGWRSLSARMAPDRGPLGICDGARRARCAEARMPGGAPPRVHCAALDAVTRAPRWETEGRATRRAAPSSGTRGMGPTPAPRGAGGAVVLPVASQAFLLRCASVSGGASRSRSATPRARAPVRSRVVCRVSPRPSAAAGCGAGAPVQRRAAPLRATPIVGV